MIFMTKKELHSGGNVETKTLSKGTKVGLNLFQGIIFEAKMLKMLRLPRNFEL